ncbi:MAG: hypothetical protein ABFC30_06555 [Proteiniphilum sp.]
MKINVPSASSAERIIPSDKIHFSLRGYWLAINHICFFEQQSGLTQFMALRQE